MEKGAVLLVRILVSSAVFLIIVLFILVKWQCGATFVLHCVVLVLFIILSFALPFMYVVVLI